MKFFNAVLSNIDTLWSFVTIPALAIFSALMLIFFPIIVLVLGLFAIYFYVSLSKIFLNRYSSSNDEEKDDAYKCFVTQIINVFIILMALGLGFFGASYMVLTHERYSCHDAPSIPFTLMDIYKRSHIICEE